MKQLGILWKQVLLYSFIFLLFIVGMIGLAYNDIQDISHRINFMVQNGFNGSLLLATDQFLDPMFQTAAQVCNDTEILHTLRQYHAFSNESTNFLSGQATQDALSEILHRHNAASTNNWRIAVYDTDGNYICDDPQMNTVHLGQNIARTALFSQNLQSCEENGYTFLEPYEDPYSSQQTLYFSLIFPITGYVGSSTLGYVEVSQTVDLLYAFLSPHIPNNLDMYLFYHWDTQRTAPILYSRNPYPHGKEESFHKTENHSDYGWDIILLRDQNTLLEDFQPLLTYLSIGIASLYALLLICIYLVARYTNKPILQLNEKVKQITLEHMPDTAVTIHATDEIRELEHSFDMMVHRLHESFQLEKRAYLHTLQAQMNPHFLYNSLSNIAAMCTTGRSEDVPELCYFLADILRYCSNFDNFSVTLADEVQNVSNYLELMKLRYVNNFDYTIQADPALISLPFPRLILQPIVENCFEHGFQNITPPWKISVDLHQEDDLWCIVISDNGCGFDPEKRRQLFSQVDDYMANPDQSVCSLQIGGLGLINTILRLRLSMDDQLFYDISSPADGGTTITLKGALHR